MTTILTFAVSLLFNAGPADSAAPAPNPVVIEGKVVPLVDALKAKGLSTDAEPFAKDVVLVATDGTIHPLLSDDASRAFFLDERVRNRKTQVHARRFAGVPYLQVVSFQIEEGGTMRTPEYYCEICTISVRFPQICPCCQGSMEFRMTPDRP